jgi:hypothetical protein
VRAPAERAAELSAVTGVPAPFIVAFEQTFKDCAAAERGIHAELDRRGLRVMPNREFFRGAPSDIIRVVLEAADGGPATAPAPHAARALLEAGDRALFGLGDALQDTGEAVRCYKLAASRGCLEALARLGSVYVRLYASRGDRASRRRAMAPLREGARRGHAACYVEMASIFALDGHHANFAKAWDRFFAQPPADGTATAEGAARFAAACRRYITLCLELGLQPLHLEAMRRVGDVILAGALAELAAAKEDPHARALAGAALRWTFTVLVPADQTKGEERPSFLKKRSKKLLVPVGC